MIAYRQVDGERVAYVLPTVPEDAPPEIREGVARRNVVALGGRCPCGAVLRMPNRAERRHAIKTGQVTRIVVEHTDDCPAVDGTINAAIRRWTR